MGAYVDDLVGSASHCVSSYRCSPNQFPHSYSSENCSESREHGIQGVRGRNIRERLEESKYTNQA